jgi:hypothetical protein
MSELNEIERRVPLQTALTNIALYKQVMTSLKYKDAQGIYHPFATYANVPRGFAILHADLLQVLGFAPDTDFPEHQHFRIYFGIEPGVNLPSLGFKYYLVPMHTNQFGDHSDHIQKGDIIIDGVVIPDQQYVCDFSLPCPNTCDTMSDLFKAGDPPVV